MNLSIQDINAIAERTAEILHEKMKAETVTFTSKSAIARHLGIDRKTVYAMIERNEILKSKEGAYQLNKAKIKS